MCNLFSVYIYRVHPRCITIQCQGRQGVKVEICF